MNGLKMSRRNSAKSAMLGSVSLTLSSGPAVRNILGANDRIGLGLIGSGNQGPYNLRSFVATGQVDVIALADVYDLPLSNALASLSLPAGKVKAHKDFRNLLEHKDIDAVIVATPEHWHAIPTIMACEAGKDVYVEKPISHTIVGGERRWDPPTPTARGKFPEVHAVTQKTEFGYRDDTPGHQRLHHGKHRLQAG